MFFQTDPATGRNAIEFLKTESDPVAASAAITMHLLVLAECSSAEANEITSNNPIDPIDLNLLYRATASAFSPDDCNSAPSTTHSHRNVMKSDIANRRIMQISNIKQRALAERFVAAVIKYSSDLELPQDLEFLVGLFVKCFQRPGIIERVESGEIAKIERAEIDFDLW